MSDKEDDVFIQGVTDAREGNRICRVEARYLKGYLWGIKMRLPTDQSVKNKETNDGG